MEEPPVFIPGGNHRTAVEQNSRKEKGDSITEAELVYLPDLDTYSNPITHLTKIEFCTNLKDLATHNRISDISVLVLLTRKCVQKS